MLSKNQLAAIWMKNRGLYDYSQFNRVSSIRKEADREAGRVCGFWVKKKAIGKGHPLKVQKRVEGFPVYDEHKAVFKTLTEQGPKKVTLHSLMIKDLSSQLHFAALSHRKDGEHIVVTSGIRNETAKQGPGFAASRAKAFFGKPMTRKLLAKDIAHELSHVHDFYNGSFKPGLYNILPYRLNPLERRAYKTAEQEMPPLKHSLRRQIVVG